VVLAGYSQNTNGYLRWLEVVEKANLTGALYLVTENLVSHKSPPILEWLETYPRAYRRRARGLRSLRLLHPGAATMKGAVNLG
jgi:hypothetical protein